MSFQVPTHFVQAYTTNVQMLLQQRGGKLMPYTRTQAWTGEGAKAVEQVGEVAPVKNLPRHSDTPLISTPADARWVYPNTYDWADLIDSDDKLRMLIDPQSSYTMNGVNAMRRAQDDAILTAFFGDAKTGKTGAVNTPFPASQQLSVDIGGVNSNLNVAKLRAAKRTLMAAGVDLEAEQIYCAVTAADHDGLLNEIQVASLDYNDMPVLKEGKVDRFMGINFIHVEFTAPSYVEGSVALSSGSGATQTRKVPVWVPSGIHFGTWEDMKVSVDRRPDKRNSVQIHIQSTFGATRLEEKRVVQINTYGGA